MLEKTRQKLNKLATTQGKMTSGAQTGFNLVLDEQERTNIKMAELSKKDDNLANRLNTVEEVTAETSKMSAEIFKMVNEINKKLSDGNVEDKAANMDFLQKIVGSKFGKAVIVFFAAALIASGVALVYVVDNYKQVSELVESVKL